MRRIALAATTLVFGFPSAFAADMPVKAPVPAMVMPAFSWTGFYIGGHGGGGWGRKCFTEAGRDEGCHDSTGWVGGGQVGLNYQISNFVLGAEFSGSGAGIRGSHTPAAILGVTEAWESRVNSIFMLTGRGGIAFDRALVYVTGGAAWVHERFNHTETIIAPPFTATADSVSKTRLGWTIGGGLEYAFTPNWSVAGQYNYIDTGTRDIVLPVLGTETVKQHLHLATLRLNYRFGPFGRGLGF